MDNFKAVYKILSALEKAMDYPKFDINDVGPEAVGVSEERWTRYIEMMIDVGYIKRCKHEARCYWGNKNQRQYYQNYIKSS